MTQLSDTIKISVLTPTYRKGGLKLPFQGLNNQTFKYFEWVVITECPEHLSLIEKGVKVFMAPPKTKFSNLNASLNEGIRRCQGELIVMLQDYIKPNPHGLQKFWDFYQEHPEPITCPVGKLDDEIRWDWRKGRQFGYLENYAEWEADWASIPRFILEELGGYDEDYDNGWSWDNANLAFRASRLGYRFWIDPTNTAIAYDHDKFLKHPYREKPNSDLHTKKMEDILSGKEPIKLNYL